jgi:hypothetical protein
MLIPRGADLSPVSEEVRPNPARGEKNTDDDATEAVRLGAVGVSSTRGACTDAVIRTGASVFGVSMPRTCRVVSSSCKRTRKHAGEKTEKEI